MALLYRVYSTMADYMSQREQEQLLAIVDVQPWMTDLKRRAQHYGYRYNYAQRTVDAAAYLRPFPGVGG